jgi:hypothetical protein
VFKQENSVDDYVKRELRHQVDTLVEPKFKKQGKLNIVFAILIAVQLGLFLFEGYVVYRGYTVVIEMQESYKKALNDWYAIPNYKSDKVENERRTKE